MNGSAALPELTGNPGMLTHLASDLERVCGMISQTTLIAQGTAASAISSTWGGTTHEARQAQVEELRTKLAKAATATTKSSDAIDTFRAGLSEANYTIRRLQADWDEEVANHRRKIQQLNADIAMDPGGYTQSEVRAIFQRVNADHEAALDDLRRRWRDALSAAEATASAAARNITAALDEFIPQSSRMSPHDIGLYLTEGIPLARDVEMLEFAQQQATEAEDLLNRFHDGDPEAIGEFISRFGNLNGSELAYFELALARELGPSGFSQFMNDMAEWRAYGTEGSLLPQALNQDSVRLMEIISGSFVTAVGGARADAGYGPNTAALYESGRAEWDALLKEQGRTVFELNAGIASDGRSGYWTTGYWGQGQLLAVAHLAHGRSPDQAFFENVGKDLLAWDTEMASDPARGFNHPRYFWGDRGSGVPFWGEAERYGAYWNADRLNDPVHNFLMSSSRSEDTATGFLLNQVRYPDGSLHSAVDYLVSARSADGLYTDQEMVARIVAEHGTNRGPDGARSVQLAHDYFDAYAKTVSDGHYTSVDGSTHALFGGADEFAKARVPIAKLMESYIDDFIAVDEDKDEGTSPWREVRGPDGKISHYTLNIDRATMGRLDAVFADLARDRPHEFVWGGNEKGDPTNPPALQRLIAASAAYNQENLRWIMGSGGTDQQIEAASLNSADFLGDLTQGMVRAWGEDSKEADALREFLLNAGKGAASKIPVGTAAGSVFGPWGTGAGFIADQTWGKVSGDIIDGWSKLVPSETEMAADRSAAVRTFIHDTLHAQINEAALYTGRWIEGNSPRDFLIAQDITDQTHWFIDGDGKIDWYKIASDPIARSYYEQFYFDPNGLKSATVPYHTAVDAGLAQAR